LPMTCPSLSLALSMLTIADACTHLTDCCVSSWLKLPFTRQIQIRPWMARGRARYWVGPMAQSRRRSRDRAVHGPEEMLPALAALGTSAGTSSQAFAIGSSSSGVNLCRRFLRLGCKTPVSKIVNQRQIKLLKIESTRDEGDWNAPILQIREKARQAKRRFPRV
jgi:hypothetical protein